MLKNLSVAKLLVFVVFRGMHISSMKEAITKCAQKLGLGRVDVVTQLTGGSINQTFRVETNTGEYVIKLNNQVEEDFFQCEQEGLLKIREYANAPRVLGVTKAGEYMCLAMEFIHSGHANTLAYDDLAYQLAALHKQTNEKFGWDKDNYMGSVKQHNKWRKSAHKFYGENRLQPLVDACYAAGKITAQDVKQFDLVREKLKELIPTEIPALVHGDLWTGNVIISGKSGYLIDPAIHYGCRETDIAMTSMFDRLPTSFYDAYNEYLPLEKGWRERIPLFQMYPILIHVQLFGEGYVNQFRKAMATYL